jgi:hypothetical protein
MVSTPLGRTTLHPMRQIPGKRQPSNCARAQIDDPRHGKNRKPGRKGQEKAITLSSIFPSM